jgi:drug/metabolite transporter (DMT)-like permease
MTTLSSDHRKGLAITAIGGLVLTVDIPLIRLAQGEPWSIMLLRSGATLAAALLIWTIWRLARGKAPALVPGRKGLIVSALYGLTAVTFIMAVYNTSTANVVFILAFNTMFAALLSWIVLKERPRNVTLAAMALMMVGVFIIVGDGIGSGNLLAGRS